MPNRRLLVKHFHSWQWWVAFWLGKGQADRLVIGMAELERKGMHLFSPITDTQP
jgi:hypothetical protein